MSNHAQKTVLITGASSGIGRATALYLAERGYSVIGTSRSADRLSSLVEEASSKGLRFTPLELDINSDEGVYGTLRHLLKGIGSVDVLVNNAGYGLWGPVEVLSTSELRAQFETNVFGSVRLIKAVVPAMVRQGRGTIINVSSVEGRLATPFIGGYAASKFALEGLSEALRYELWPFGIRVAIVEPGLFDSDFHRNQLIAGGAKDPGSAYSSYIERYHARRARYDRLTKDPVQVAKVIGKIIRSRRPAFRHPVGLEAKLGMLSARLLPERLFQALLSRATLR